MSRKQKNEYHRFFTVTDTRTHEKGHTEYRITARFVLKSRPDDVKEVVVWRRFSELKKLHGELAYTHRNLFRREEEFPPFPRAQVFGRFEEAVIEERRKAAEVMFNFTTTIPALYNSPQLKDFFRDGEVSRPLDPPLDEGTLPPPLIPLPKRRASDCLPAEEETGHEAPTLPQDLGHNLSLDPGLDLGQPEVAAEAFSEVGGSPERASDSELEERVPSPIRVQDLQDLEASQEELNSLFDPEDPPEDPAPALSDTDLAAFDPFCKEGDSGRCSDHSELFSLPVDSLSAGASYLSAAAAELSAAVQKEQDGHFGDAIAKYRTAVDILITGVQGDPEASRREAVMRRTAHYLQHVETLVDKYSSPTHT